MRRKFDTDENLDYDPNNGISNNNNNNNKQIDTNKQAASSRDLITVEPASGATNETNLEEPSRSARLVAFSVRMNKKWVDLMEHDSWNVEEKELRRKSCATTRSSRLLADEEPALDCSMVETVVEQPHRAHSAVDKRARSTSSLSAANQQQQQAKRRRRVPRLNRKTDTVGQVTRAAAFNRQTADEDSGHSSGSTSPHQPSLAMSAAAAAAAASVAKDDSSPRAAKEVNPKPKPNTCAACHKPIRERYLLQSMDKQWHEDCLKCACCDCRLGEVGSSLFTHSGKILCRRDFLRIFGQQGLCAACKRSIPPYELVMRANENAYHMDCFNCQQCQYRFCVGDRFHLTESQRIVCLLCHAESVSASASTLGPSSVSAGSQQQQKRQQQPQLVEQKLQQVAAAAELEVELEAAGCQSALQPASSQDEPGGLVSNAPETEQPARSAEEPTAAELAASGHLQPAAAT